MNGLLLYRVFHSYLSPAMLARSRQPQHSVRYAKPSRAHRTWSCLWQDQRSIKSMHTRFCGRDANLYRDRTLRRSARSLGLEKLCRSGSCNMGNVRLGQLMVVVRTVPDSSGTHGHNLTTCWKAPYVKQKCSPALSEFQCSGSGSVDYSRRLDYLPLMAQQSSPNHRIRQQYETWW